VVFQATNIIAYICTGVKILAAGAFEAELKLAINPKVFVPEPPG
jgi:hypothetical protein